MQIIQSDFKIGTVRLKVENSDDLWYLSHLIDQGDLLTSKTTRKIKIGDGENAKVVKKVLTLTIQADSIDFSDNATALRINGKVKEGPEDVPKESYHALELEKNTEFTLQKKQWLSYQKQKLLESAEKKSIYLLCLFDREEALLAITKKNGYETILKLSGDVPKKTKIVEIKKDFQEEIIKALTQYQERYHPENIILASPAFYKDDLLKKITSPELKKKIVLAISSDISESSINEVLRRPELTAVLKSNRARQEQLIVEEVLSEINKEGRVAYGWEEVKKAVTGNAVKTLVITDEFIQKKRRVKEYEELDQIMKQVDAADGKIHLLSSEYESGKKINGLGGIAALLRFKLEW
jgi:protein pelota